MGSLENIAIFDDTLDTIAGSPALLKSLARSTSLQIVYPEDCTVDVPAPRFGSTEVTLVPHRTMEAASHLPGRTAVLNFASFHTPGGGVVNGSSAQEECLCRVSTLYICLKDKRMAEGFYEPHLRTGSPLYNSDVIYTPGVTVFKSDTASPELLPRDKWYDVDVVTCAAPNLSGISIDPARLRELQYRRISRVLEVCALNGDDNVVLGAFGCGVFGNDPHVVADASLQAVSDFDGHFRQVVFAVYCRPGDPTNYVAFESALRARGSHPSST